MREQETGAPTTDNRLYIDKHYAVKIINPGIYNHDNIPLLVLDGLVETLNHNPKVPHTMVIIINDKRFWNNKDFLKLQMEWVLRKFFKELHKIIDARKYALDDKAVNWDYPRLLVTRPLPLPSNLPSENYPTGFRSNRRKFNKILDKARETGKFTMVNLDGFTSQNKDKFFNHDGSISEKGYEQVWIEISDCVQKQDEKQRKIANKIKAKQIAQEMAVELMKSDESDIECSSSPLGKKTKSDKKSSTKRSPARRSLASNFEAMGHSDDHSPPPPHRVNINSSPANHRKRQHFYPQGPKGYHNRQRRQFHNYPPFYHQYHEPGYGPRYFPY